MTQSKRLVFFGNEHLVSGLTNCDAPILNALIDAGYDIAAVVLNQAVTRSRSTRKPRVLSVADSYGIPVILTTSMDDLHNDLHNMAADFAVLASYGRLLPKRVLDVFSEYGIINIHPSLLPHGRGPSPIESAILLGETITGVSLMRLTEAMDEGPIYAQSALALNGSESKESLYKTLSTMGAQLLIETLPHILDHTISGKSQPEKDVSYTTQILKSDGVLNASTDTAVQMERKVRAYQSFPKPRMMIGNNVVIITSSIIVDSLEAGDIVIKCRDDSYLSVVELIAPSGKRMSAGAFLRGYTS